jgi:LPXTG-site transpeptidase (sortase) family protein
VGAFLSSRALVVLAAVVLLLGTGVAAVFVAPIDKPEVDAETRYAGVFRHRATRADVRGEEVPPPVSLGSFSPAQPELFVAPIARLRIARIGVDAPISRKGITDGTMENPDGPDDVAWYTFTAKPGVGSGNAVFSGHLDFIRRGPAVFWDLRKLADGDIIDVVLEDGVIITYAVTFSRAYPADQVPMEEVVGYTSTETITLITCSGSFQAGDYSDRLVLRAAKVGVVRP